MSANGLASGKPAGVQTQATRPPMPVEIWGFRSVRSGALRGFASVGIGALLLHDVAVFVKDGQASLAMPSKPVLAGNAVARDEGGKPRRTIVAEWRNPKTARRFSDAVIAALEARYPNALHGDGGAS